MTADPPVEERVVFVPAIAWAVPAAAVLAVIGAFLPWFRPRGTLAGHTRTFDALYSIKDKAGLVVPVLLVLASISVIGLLLGRPRGRLAGHPQPARLAGLYSIAAGAGSVVAMAVAAAMVPSLYGFVVSARMLSWHQYEQAGVHLERGPQVGFWLTGAAAVVSLGAGTAIMLLIRRDRPSDPE